ncbi:MAG: hypothetical protein EB127_14430 [Alphaproteobacteria bacterium]|nr:hypothetical protein [Alphaproteobacteria bacterium]
MDILPETNSISLDTLEKYIERHPEDAEKWLEFIRDPAENAILYGNQGERRRWIRREVGEINEELYNKCLDLHSVPSEVPVEHYRDGCLLCKKSWTSTEDVPTTTFICGHKFHTTCTMVNQYYNDTFRCGVEGCDIDTWDYVRKIVRSKEKAISKVENILIDSYRKRKDFKQDVNELNNTISSSNASHTAVRKLIEQGRKEFIHKHLYSINQMQNDLNQGMEFIRNSEEMDKYKKSVRVYRKKANYIFRKYHISSRELRERNILRMPWRLRWVLERHRNAFSYYKMGFRLYPGKKQMKDPLNTRNNTIENV